MWFQTTLLSKSNKSNENNRTSQACSTDHLTNMVFGRSSAGNCIDENRLTDLKLYITRELLFMCEHGSPSSHLLLPPAHLQLQNKGCLQKKWSVTLIHWSYMSILQRWRISLFTKFQSRRCSKRDSGPPTPGNQEKEMGGTLGPGRNRNSWHWHTYKIIL